MPIRGKLISEISPADIHDLILQQTPEDQFLEFKAELLDPRKPRALDANRADWVSDLVAFANAQGGHIIVGVAADKQERASGLRPMTGDDAKKLADSLRDLAIAYIKPSIIQLEIRSFEITSTEWIVIAGVPHSSEKPHMSSMQNGTRFTVRDGNRKRVMAHDEIRRFYLDGPQQQLLMQFIFQVEEIKSQVESIHSRLDRLEQELRKTE